MTFDALVPLATLLATIVAAFTVSVAIGMLLALSGAAVEALVDEPDGRAPSGAWPRDVERVATQSRNESLGPVHDPAT